MLNQIWIKYAWQNIQTGAHMKYPLDLDFLVEESVKGPLSRGLITKYMILIWIVSPSKFLFFFFFLF